jgi:hypothetical protein
VALLAAAIAIAAVAVAVAEASAIVALFRTPTMELDKDRVHPMTPVEVARGLREQAIAKCARGEWKACGEQLDAAKRIDPGGEGEARVVKARGELEEAVGGGVKVPGPREQRPEDQDWK